MRRIVTTVLLSMFMLPIFAQTDEGLNTTKDKVLNEFHDIILSMPAPITELEDLHTDKVKFNEHLLSPADNVKQYQSDGAEGINLGIYMVDLAYLAVFHKQEEMLKYRTVAAELAVGLEAAAAFHDVLDVHLEKKIKDHQAVKTVIDEAIDATEEYLIEKDKLEVACQILLGSWVETQYIVLQSFIKDKKKSEEVKLHIKEQQVHLANLIKLIHEFKDDAGMVNELELLSQLETSFQKIHNLDELTDDIILELTNEITRLRMDIVAME